MGYPASAANLFRALTEPEDSWLHSDAKSLVSKYKLFSIILADPIKDPVFYAHLKDNFSHYDRLTGKYFMFISIVKENEINDFNGANKRYLVFNDKESYKGDLVAENSSNPELVIHAICNTLNINYDETPCLLISNNLQFGKFIKVNTNINTLEDQLKELSIISTKIESETDLVNLLEINKIFSNSYEPINIQKNSLLLISEILQSNESRAFLGLPHNGSPNSLRQSTKYRNIFSNDDLFKIQEIFGLLNPILNKSFNQQISSSLLNEMHESEISYEAKNKYHKSNLKFELNITNPSSTIFNIINRWKNIEQSTKNQILSAYTLSKSEAQFQDNADYSPYTSLLCKSFEIEINLSIVQLIRKYFGIKMPKYFSKYCPEFGQLNVIPSSTLVSDPRPIPLNAEVNYRWLQPSLGHSYYAYSTLRIDSPNFGNKWSNSEIQDILQNSWEKIYKIRNKSMHSDIVNSDSRDKLNNTFNDLMIYDLLNKMTQLKLNLRN